jgi:peptidyl-tRNA hydrolase, PTH1 family
MKLVVGLGNPGRKYVGTRHNVGYEILGALAKKHGCGPVRQKFHGETAEAEIGGEKILLLSPTTYMNLSGVSVAEARNFYKIGEQELLVICDDLNLPLGRLRFRENGSSGGQKGLGDILARLGTDNVPRLRVGIGSPPDSRAWADFVLTKFTPDELPWMEEAIRRAVDAVEAWIARGIHYCMNHYNKETGNEDKGDTRNSSSSADAGSPRSNDT